MPEQKDNGKELILIKILLEMSVFRPVLKTEKEGLWRKAKGREFHACTAEKRKGLTTFFSFFLSVFFKWGYLSSIIRRRVQRPRRDINLDNFSQVTRAEQRQDVWYLLNWKFCACMLKCNETQVPVVNNGRSLRTVYMLLVWMTTLARVRCVCIHVGLHKI